MGVTGIYPGNTGLCLRVAPPHEERRRRRGKEKEGKKIVDLRGFGGGRSVVFLVLSRGARLVVWLAWYFTGWGSFFGSFGGKLCVTMGISILMFLNLF